MDLDFLLLQRIKKSDEDATEIFVTKYYKAIFKYCFIHIQDYGYAQDLAQNTFMKFFGNLDRYNHYGKALNYLYVIASNECKDYYRKNKELLMEDTIEEKHISNNYETFEKTEIKMEVENALEKLPDELKEVAILFFFQNIKQKEIAKILGIGLSLVKYRVSKAKRLLSEYLKESEDEYN